MNTTYLSHNLPIRDRGGAALSPLGINAATTRSLEIVGWYRGHLPALASPAPCPVALVDYLEVMAAAKRSSKFKVQSSLSVPGTGTVRGVFNGILYTVQYSTVQYSIAIIIW
jgi:hypothetical protein